MCYNSPHYIFTYAFILPIFGVSNIIWPSGGATTAAVVSYPVCRDQWALVSPQHAIFKSLSFVSLSDT